MKDYTLRGGVVRECDCPPKDRHDHGTRRMYTVHLCGCFACRLANNRSLTDYKSGIGTVERFVDPTGTVRRLRALSAIGVTRGELAERLGVSERAVQYLRNTKRPVLMSTVRRVCAVYDELWDATRTGRGPNVAKARAKNAGWPPPLAYDDDTIDDPTVEPHRPVVRDRNDIIDEVAVEEAVRGRHVKLTLAERAEAVRRLTASGHSAHEIADRLRTTKRSVVRRRARTAA